MAVSFAEPAQAVIAEAGFAFVGAEAMLAMLSRAGSLSDWNAFRDSWNDLALDTYMADGGRYRRRRHAVFAATPSGIVRLPHQAHYQTVEYNRLHGGIERWFEPIAPAIGGGDTMRAVLACSRAIFEGLSPVREWRVEVHQFRIEAREGERGKPTPEGVHRDGVDYVIVLLIDRSNVTSGVTSVYALDGRQLGSFTLTAALDAALLDDARVAHGVTAISPLDPSKPAHRDVLVVTWVKSEGAEKTEKTERTE
jgi:hypothetical protein